MAEVRIEPWTCTHCGQLVDAASSVRDDDAVPKEDDITLCFYCTELHIMHNGKFVALTDDELIDLPLEYKALLSALQVKLRKYWKEQKS